MAEEAPQSPDEPPGIRPYFSRSVRDVGDELGWGQVTSWQIVHILLRDHAHYGGSSLLPLDQNTGRIQPMEAWLEEVAGHFDLDAVRARRDPKTEEPGVIDGRMTILGLTFVDPYLASALEAAGFRRRLQDDIGPGLDELLKSPEGDDVQPAAQEAEQPLASDAGTIELQALTGHEGDVYSLALGRLGEREVIVSGSSDGTVRLWGADGASLQTLTGHQGVVESVALGRLGEREVIVSGGGETVRLWGADGASLQTLTEHEGVVESVALGRLGEREVIVSGDSDGTVRLWGADGASLHTLTGHNHWVLSVALGRLGERDVIVSGGEDGTVRLWGADGASLQTLTGHQGVVYSVALGRLGEREVIVSGGEDGTVRLWGADGASLQTLTGHQGVVRSVALGRLGERDVIVSGGEDGTVRLWGADGASLQTLTGHQGVVYSVALGRLGEREVIVSGAGDGTVRLWGLPERPDDSVPDRDDDQHDQQDAIELVGDHAATTDELGRAPIAHDLARRLARIHHDDPDHKGSFLVHLDGPWGAGKSSILNFLRDDLEARDPPWLVVEFNAWRDQVRPSWWALLTALRSTLQSELTPLGRVRFWCAELWRRVRQMGAAEIFAALFFVTAVIALGLAWLAGLFSGGLTTIAGLVTTAAALIAVVLGAGRVTGRFLFWASARSARDFEQSEERPRKRIDAQFSWLTDIVARDALGRRPWMQRPYPRASSGVRSPWRVNSRPTIFIIDDLDRCEAEHVVELMEAVQNLIRDTGAGRGPYFVIAADGRWIRRSYESYFEHFGDSVAEPGRPLGYLFLDKLFQMSVQVPSMTGGDQDAFMGRLLGVGAGDIPVPEATGQEPASKEQVLERVEAGAKEEDFTAAVAMAEALPAAERQEVVARVVAREAEQVQAVITAHRLQPYARHLPTNPRTIKRFVNAYEIARAVDRVEGRAVRTEQRAIWTVLRLRWPSLAEELQLDPDLLDRLDSLPTDPEREAMLKLLAHGDVVRLLSTAKGAPFRAADLRACCGLDEPAPRDPAPT